MNDWGFEPDFENLKNTLLWKKNYRVPNMEFVIDREIKEAYLKREVVTLEDEIDFRHRAGYDYIWISKGMIDPAGTVNKEFVSDDPAKHFKGKDTRVWAEEHTGIIETKQDIENYPWPDIDKMDFSEFEKAGELLPEGMKVFGVCGKIFVATWMLFGFENFVIAAIEQPELVDELINTIGEIQVRACKKMIEFDCVGGIWVPDDIAYRTGTVMPPEWLKEKIFPFYKSMGKMIRKADKLFLYHSDGNLLKMLDIIIDTGFNGLHPIEPESMDISDVRKRVGKKLALIGNVCVHTLATGTKQDIINLTMERIEKYGKEGGYAVGSSNSIPNYVPIENYLAMLETNAKYGFIS
ncbi:MAG TPA: uroporphyrinogen decarboxylase family protein [bacterium]|nr:uroporphyrinogen decarboxylase family protein [bacterium]HOL34444.1 uroporphyrinogen decarboxylase family protein [bacterium]HPP08269.1 uroporphyrinogen decarboxylase family protein [bacterium]